MTKTEEVKKLKVQIKSLRAKYKTERGKYIKMISGYVKEIQSLEDNVTSQRFTISGLLDDVINLQTEIKELKEYR